MSIDVYVMSKDVDSVSKLKIDGKEILSTLGKKEDAFALKLQEVFQSVKKSILPTIENESDLTIEVTGSVSMKASGGIQYLFFNIGGEAGKTGTTKVTLKTTLQP